MKLPLVGNKGSIESEILATFYSALTVLKNLISENNFETAFEYNFSERISIFNYTDLENFNEIDTMLSDDNTRINLKKLSRSIFDEHFNSNSLIEKHNVVYSKEKIQTNKFLDLLLNYLFVLKNMVLTQQDVKYNQLV